MKEGEAKTPEVPEIKMRSERRAAKVASTKIAESAKYLASNKIMATTALPPTPRRAKPHAKPSPKNIPPPQAPHKGAVRPPSTHTLPKMPILVFNSIGTSVPTIIPIPTSSLTPNSIVSFSPTSVKPPIDNLQTKKPASSISLSQPSSKFLRYNSATRQNIGLSMECDEETLSPVQWAKYRKAESDYLDVLRKLTKWKSRTDVEIIYLGADDPVPPPPRFLNVQEASRQPVPNVADGSTCFQEVFVEPDSVPMQVDSQQSPMFHGTVDKDSITAQNPPLKVLLSPRINLVVTPTIRPHLGQTTVTTTAATTSSGSAGPVTKTMNVPTREIIVLKKPDLATACSSVIDLLKHPELVVKLSPQKLTPYSVVTSKKYELDTFLKKLMQSGKMALEKWMLEKGLFGASRSCVTHPHVQMKLMHMSSTTDGGKMNGYKWWCPSCAVMVPVNHGSFFSKWKQDHCAVLRAIYHWACNSDIKMAIQEMLGNKEFVHSVYAAHRTICTKQSRNWQLGGTGHPIEIAQMKMGNCKGTVQVVLYCAYDRVTHFVKLGAASEAFINNKISVLLNYFIDKNSYVVGDPSLLTQLPAHFKQNFVSNSSQIVNLNASAYLSDIVLPTFKDIKNYLKLDSIQGLLHELEWREKFGRDPLKAFNNMVTHIKQAFFTSAVTTQGVNSVPIAMASGLKVVDTSKLTQDLPQSSVESSSATVRVKKTDGESKTDKNSLIQITVPHFTYSPLTNSNSTLKRSSIYSVASRAKKAKKGSAPCEQIKVSETVSSLRVRLECYYYATKEGVDQKTEKGKFKFKCQACKKSLEDNTKMMKHLHGHINALKQFNLDLSDLTHCKYCFREFASPYAMQSHVEEVHVNEPVTPVCRICDKEFQSVNLLCAHMKSLHKESEMPYKCQVCKYRTSFYRDLIGHFEKVHNKTDKLMCNYCLQVFTVRFGEGIQEGQTYSFYRHLYKHQSKTHNRRCQSCCLAFLSTTELQQHRSVDHCSFRNKKGVKRAALFNSPKVVYIDIDGFAESGTEKVEERQYLCIECKLPINKANHFVNSLRCSMCSYTTCCSRGFADHAITSHSKTPPRPCLRSFYCVVNEMSCPCGFLSQSGDRMAKHLSMCESKSCCLTDSDCDENDPLDLSACLELTTAIEYDDESYSDTNEGTKEEEDESKCNETVRNEDQHNMMNVLGLMRVKPQRGAGGRFSSSSRPSSITRSTSSDNSTDQ